MNRKAQLSFLPSLKHLNPRLEHGGDVGKGRRKVARPIDPKRPLHLVLRASRAKGEWSLLRPAHQKAVDVSINEAARRFSVRVHQRANVGNHIHLLVKAPTRQAVQHFLRYLAGRLAFRITGAKKGKSVGRFWDRLVYSRVVSWGREFRTVSQYLIRNLIEGALGLRRDPTVKVLRLDGRGLVGMRP